MPRTVSLSNGISHRRYNRVTGAGILQDMKPYKEEKDNAIDLSRLEIMILSTLIGNERYGLEIVE